MAASYGIDTSILVRLVTGDPEEGFQRCVTSLARLIEREDAEVFASNDYDRRGLVTLTLDRKMAALSEARLLK